MEAIISWLAEQAWGIFTGVITALIVAFIVVYVPLKEKTQYKAKFYGRKFLRWIRNSPIKISYTVKSSNLEEKKFVLKDFVQIVKQKLAENNFKSKGEQGSTLLFSHILGKTEVEISLIPSYKHDEEKNELMVNYLECDFKLIGTGYNNFNGHLLDLIQIFRKLELSLEDVVGKWKGESLTCEIKRLYNFVGVLKDLKMSSLKGKIGGQYEIEMFEKKLIVYGSIDTTMTGMLKDIITYYY